MDLLRFISSSQIAEHYFQEKMIIRLILFEYFKVFFLTLDNNPLLLIISKDRVIISKDIVKCNM